MGRKYELKRRAERQEETRRRIAAAALELHSTIGPAQTTISAIADLAGVQRHTFYRHFPDDYSLGLACSGLHVERHPPPDPKEWASVEDPHERLRTALRALYAFWARHEQLYANLFRDAELQPVMVGEVLQLRFGPWLDSVHEILARGLPDRPRTRAALDLALDFHAWRRLKRSGLSAEDAAETMAAAVAGQ